MNLFQFNSAIKYTTNNKNNKKIKENQEIETPDYFDIISEEDQYQYRELQKILESPDNRYARNRRIETLKESIDQIKKFCLRNDENDWKRCLVCGVIWLDKFMNSDSNEKKVECISINIRQLRAITGKSKSTINGALSKMGFSTFPTKGEDHDLLIRAMPYFEGKYFEMRQWTIRKRELNEKSEEVQKETDLDNIFSFLPFDDKENENEDFHYGGFNFNDQDFWLLNNDDKTVFGFNIESNDQIELALPSSKYNTINTGVNYSKFTDTESILEFNSLVQINNFDMSQYKEIAQWLENPGVLNFLIFSSYLYMYFLYLSAVIAFRAGHDIPHLIY